MSTYKILVDDTEEFVTVCAGLVREGICFEASLRTMTITCTGGY